MNDEFNYAFAIIISIGLIGIMVFAFSESRNEENRANQCKDRGGFYVQRTCWKGEKLP